MFTLNRIWLVALISFQLSLVSQTIYKDFNPGKAGSQVYVLSQTDTALLLSLDDGVNGLELWYMSLKGQRDPYMIKNISEGDTSSNFATDVYFDGERWWLFKYVIQSFNSQYELYVTEGTENGTKKLALLKGTTPYSQLNQMVMFNHKFYFTGVDSSGYFLWESDGTPEGTKKSFVIEDEYRFGSIPRQLTVLEDKLYYFAYTKEHGYEWWCTDGTEEGTKLVIDLAPGVNSGVNTSQVYRDTINNKIYFVGSDDLNKGYDVYETNGEASGTKLFMDFNVGSVFGQSPQIFKLNDTLFFITVNRDTEYDVYLVNALNQKVNKLNINTVFKNIYNIHSVSLKDGIYYIQAFSVDFGNEIWLLKPPFETLELLMDIEPGQLNGVNSEIFWRGKKGYFLAQNQFTGFGLWRTEGAFENTQMYLNFPDPAYITNIIQKENQLLIFGFMDYNYGHEIYSIDLSTTLKTEQISPALVYPNPLKKGQVLNLDRLPEGEIKLIDIYGNCVWKGVTTDNCIMKETWSAGIYFLYFKFEGQTGFLKITLLE